MHKTNLDFVIRLSFVMIPQQRRSNNKMRKGSTAMETNMSTQTTDTQTKPTPAPKVELHLNYRPLGLKAVAAAAMMLSKPKVKTA